MLHHSDRDHDGHGQLDLYNSEQKESRLLLAGSRSEGRHVGVDRRFAEAEDIHDTSTSLSRGGSSSHHLGHSGGGRDSQRDMTVRGRQDGHAHSPTVGGSSSSLVIASNPLSAVR